MVHSGDGGDSGRSRCGSCCCGGCCYDGYCYDCNSAHVSLFCSTFPPVQCNETLSCFFLCSLADHSSDHSHCYSGDYYYYCCCDDSLWISLTVGAEVAVCRNVPRDAQSETEI